MTWLRAYLARCRDCSFRKKAAIAIAITLASVAISQITGDIQYVITTVENALAGLTVLSDN